MYIYICIYVYIFVSYPETMYNIILTFSLPCIYVYNSYLQNLHLYLYIYICIEKYLIVDLLRSM